MRKTKIFMVTMLATLLILGGCTRKEENKEERQSTQKTESNRTDVESTEKEQEEKTLDDLDYTYSDDTCVTVHLFELDEKKKIMVTIKCSNSDFGFACLCYMQSAIMLASTDEEVDYIIMLNNDGDTFGELREDGKLRKITETPDFEDVYASDEEVEKSIEYGGKLDEFIKRNDLNN